MSVLYARFLTLLFPIILGMDASDLIDLLAFAQAQEMIFYIPFITERRPHSDVRQTRLHVEDFSCVPKFQDGLIKGKCKTFNARMFVCRH